LRVPAVEHRLRGRPILSNASARLGLCDDGRVRYTMKKPWREGTLELGFMNE
jgi:hypothetical protein